MWKFAFGKNLKFIIISQRLLWYFANVVHISLKNLYCGQKISLCMQSMVNGRSFARQNHRFAHGSWRSKRLYPSARACEFWIFLSYYCMRWMWLKMKNGWCGSQLYYEKDNTPITALNGFWNKGKLIFNLSLLRIYRCEFSILNVIYFIQFYL